MTIYCNTLEGNMQYSNDPYCFTPSCHTCFVSHNLIFIMYLTHAILVDCMGD